MMTGYNMMLGLGWLGMGLATLFWIGVIVLIVWGLSRLFPVSQQPAAPDALAILQRRYARGEIDHAEYLQARAALRES